MSGSGLAWPLLGTRTLLETWPPPGRRTAVETKTRAGMGLSLSCRDILGVMDGIVYFWGGFGAWFFTSGLFSLVSLFL